MSSFSTKFQKRGLEYLNSPEKRALDLTTAAALLGILALPIAGVGVISAIDSRRINPIFTQQRLGPDGVEIEVLKFATLRGVISQGSSAKTYGTFDPRATWVGQLMRQYGLDELPQLLNVMRGDMSMVGPRPLVAVDMAEGSERHRVGVDGLFDEWLRVYNTCKPGIVGRGQFDRHRYVQVPDDVLAQSMQDDISYVNTATFRSDIMTISMSPLEIVSINRRLAMG